MQDADNIMTEIERQLRERRAAGYNLETLVLDLGDEAYRRLAQRAGTEFEALQIRGVHGIRVWFPGTPAEDYSPDVERLTVRRVGPGDRAQILSA